METSSAVAAAEENNAGTVVAEELTNTENNARIAESIVIRMHELDSDKIDTKYEEMKSLSENDILNDSSKPLVVDTSDRRVMTFFREPTKIFEALKVKAYAVHIIFAHSSIPVPTATMPDTFFHLTNSKFPVAVLQTGGPEGIGCSFRFTNDYVKLMTTDLKYTLTMMLTDSTTSLPPILKDIHYATSDTITRPGGQTEYEDVPERILKLSENEINLARIINHGDRFGVYSYIPSLTNNLLRDNRFDALLREGVYASYLLPRIPYIAGTFSIPNIFLIVGCLRLKKRVPVSKIASTYKKYYNLHQNPSRYSVRLNAASKPSKAKLNLRGLKKITQSYSVNPTAHIIRPKGGPRNYVTRKLRNRRVKSQFIRQQLKRGDLTITQRKELLKKLKGLKTRRMKRTDHFL